MDSFFEKNREEDLEIEIQKNQHNTFLPHFHSNVEIGVVLNGTISLYCNGRNYLLDKGCVYFFDSFDIHGIVEVTGEAVENRIIIIPSKFLGRFNNQRNNLRLKCPVLKSLELAEACVKIIDDYIDKESDEYIKTSAVDLLLSIINSGFNFEIKSFDSENNLIVNILNYIQNNYTKKISLAKMAKQIGYNVTYVSKTFHEYFNRSIPSYINDLRLKHVEKKLSENPNQTITKIIFDAGFSSIQTYYRNRAKKKF